MTVALHPDLRPEERQRLLREGVELFNAGRFFEAHDSWEEVWRSTRPQPKLLLQGLILVAVSMVHHRDRGRPAVALRVLGKARRRIEPFAPSALGLDLRALLADVERWQGWLELGDGDPPPLPRLEVEVPSRLR